MKITKHQDGIEAFRAIAAANRADFEAAGVLAIAIAGPAGAGKTSAIERLLTRLEGRARAAVLIGSLAADRQISRITRHGFAAIPLFTDAMTAVHVRQAIARLDLRRLELLLIEVDGESQSAAESDLGQKHRICVFSAAGGDDKATEYPFLVADSEAVLLTKTDLMPFVTFDMEVFSQDVQRLKAGLEIIMASAQRHHGVDDFADWIEARLSEVVENRSAVI